MCFTISDFPIIVLLIVYMASNVGYTVYVTGKENERRLQRQKELQAQQAAELSSETQQQII